MNIYYINFNKEIGPLVHITEFCNAFKKLNPDFNVITFGKVGGSSESQESAKQKRTRIHFDLHKSKELFNFEKWVLGNSITIYLANQIDKIMVGKLLGVSALGFYAMAFNRSVLPMKELTAEFSRVAFPGYAKVQDDQDKI